MAGMDLTLPIGAASLFAAYVIGRKKWWGWLVSASTAVAWTAWGFHTSQWGLVLECVPISFIHLHNASKWRTA